MYEELLPERSSAPNQKKKLSPLVKVVAVSAIGCLVAACVVIAAGVWHKRHTLVTEPSTNTQDSTILTTLEPSDNAAGNVWWKERVMYQIYPRSFQDSNGDGVGDIKGITQRVPYLKEIGVGQVWISPMYKSPMRDFGYDVSDYEVIDPLFGDMDDFDGLIKELHAHDIKLIMDFVPNHTSDQHAWFQESSSSRDNAKSDWYVWKDAVNGGPPNNWLSVFGGSMWEWNETRQQYYLHQFVKQQPDLNFRNPEVMAAIQNVMRFWLKKGVDGFRVDAVPHLMEDALLRDEPKNPDWDPSSGPDYDGLLHIYTKNFDGVHDVGHALRTVFDEFTDEPRVMIAEAYADLKTTMSYYGTADTPEFHYPFNFQLLPPALTDINASTMYETIKEYVAAIPVGGTGNWVVGNHDNHRVMDRIGGNEALQRAVLTMTHTLPGVPTQYYGDELGMHDVFIPFNETQDPFAHQNPKIFDKVGRDPERTPMQWTCAVGAGFTTPETRPWLRIAKDWCANSVDTQTKDPSSHLSMYKALTTLRESTPAFTVGGFRLLEGDEHFVAYERFVEGTRMVVVANLSGDSVTVDVAKVLQLQTGGSVDGTVLYTSDMKQATGVTTSLAALALQPHQAQIVKISA
eukprot:GFYU01003867.1.p1 GENE.GFYU01003867.1~~GFYU01003867.1.p1  ORF type:complete len:627 (+),score=199.22 GFYU01003867.1:95-1975(+)